MKAKRDEVRNKVRFYLEKGLSNREIADILNIGHSTVQRIRKKHGIASTKVNTGRPRKLSAQEHRRLVRYVTLGEAGTATEAAEALKRDTGTQVSKWTIARALNREKFHAIVKKKKPLLSDKNIKRRKEFVKQYEKQSEEKWSKVIWSDESKINRYQSDGRHWTWKRDGESLQPRDVNQTVKHGGGHIKVWGCFSAHGVGPICKIDGNMNKEMYLKILKTHVAETVDFMPYPDEEIVFQHDNDPKHTAKVVKNWLGEQSFTVMDHPPQSPDVNPIENLWSYLKVRLAKDFDSPPSNLNALWERVQQTWYNIPNGYCKKLAKGMPRRVAAVRKAKFMWTKY